MVGGMEVVVLSTMTGRGARAARELLMSTTFCYVQKESLCKNQVFVDMFGNKKNIYCKICFLWVST